MCSEVEATDLGFSVEFPCQVCRSIEFNRFGLNNARPDSLGGYNMIVKNRWGSSVVPFRMSRSTHPFGYMGIFLGGEEHSIEFEFHEHITNVSYSAKMYDFGQSKGGIRINHEFRQSTDYAEINGCSSHDLGAASDCFEADELTDETLLTDLTTDPLSYFISDVDNHVTYSFGRQSAVTKYYDLGYSFRVFKCFWDDCIPPTTPPPTTPPVISQQCNWSDATCWKDGVVPIAGSNVTIDLEKEVTIDQDIDVDRLYVEGTVRVCQNCGDIRIKARAILINTGKKL